MSDANAELVSGQPPQIETEQTGFQKIIEKTDTSHPFIEAIGNAANGYFQKIIEKLPPAHDHNGNILADPRSLQPEEIDDEYDPYETHLLGPAFRGLRDWQDNEFKRLINTMERPDSNIEYTDSQKRLFDLQAYLRHDLGGDLFNAFEVSLTDDEDMRVLPFIANPYTIEWPLHIIERIHKQAMNRPENKPIHGHYANRFIYGVFQSLTRVHGGNFTYDIDYKTPFEVEGDFDYLLGVLANPLNNIKQLAEDKRMKDVKTRIRVFPDSNNPEHIILQIRDNIGGMPDDLLQPSESDPSVQKALERGQTRRKGGTGAGLAIVNDIVTNNFQGRISLRNEPYPETDQMGLVIDISMPGKMLSK